MKRPINLIKPAALGAVMLWAACFGSATADELGLADDRGAPTAGIQEASREQAKLANEAAANDAATAVKADVRQDLEIQLVALNSEFIVGET